MTTMAVRIPNNGPPERYLFWIKVVNPIPGWLDRPAAIHTMDILECQDVFGMQGSLLEIGVYSGKFFSILARQACLSNTVAVGIDPFDLADMDATRQYIAPAIAGDGSNIKLQRAFSCEFDTRRLLDTLGSYARFISIDGSHEKPDVFYDLTMAEQVVASGGVIAVDDFLNYQTPGVNEGVFEFFSTPRRVVPFAFIKNKLFLTVKNWVPRYQAMLEDKIVNDDVEEHSQFFRHRLAEGRSLVEKSFWGSPVLLIP